MEENFNLEDDLVWCKTLYQLKVHFMISEVTGVSDKTKIQECPWSVLKEFAMMKNYRK